MKNLFVDFLKSRTCESFLAVRSALVVSEHYSPYSNEMDDIPEMIDAGRLTEARARISESMPNLLLSPRAHFLLASIGEKSGDQSFAQMERFFGGVCLEGILATGDGSIDRPYIVCRTSDEHDVVWSFGKKATGQALVPDGSRVLDRLSFDAAEDIWFDITDAHRKLEALLHPKELP